MASSKTAEVYGALREELLNGVHRPGTKLTIDNLTERFLVSAGAVREALARLTSDRLVVALPQRGFVVAMVSSKDLLDLTEVRIDIERKCLVSSIANGSVDWEARLVASWHRLSKIGATPEGRTHPDWARLHGQFHDDLVSACDNAWWLRLRSELYIQAERYRRMALPRAQAMRDVEAEHRTIIDYTLARDADRAAAALAEHLQRTTRSLLEMHLFDYESNERLRGAALGR